MRKISLNGEWLFKNAEGKAVKRFIPGEVPGTVHTDLLKNKLIPDPFFRKNEKDLQWIGKTEWVYKKTFSLDEKFLSYKKILLNFQGIDTFSEVYLNGKLLGKTENMFHPYIFEVKGLLKKRNFIEVRFQSPVKYLRKLERKYGVLGGPFATFRSYGRKAQYSFGWDWGPVFATSGLWKDVFLSGFNFARIENIFIKQTDISKERALLDVQIEVDSLLREDFLIEVEINNGEIRKKKSFINHFHDRFNLIKTNFKIDNPKLWYPNGYGEPFLYTLNATLIYKGKIIDEFHTKFGLRKIEIIQEKDKEGRNFIFKINDVPIFAKGMNWIPSDSFLPRVKENKYKKLVSLMKEGNMNMVRVWGGGVYEDDLFYNFCDEMGIMIWQDFMSACHEVPDHLDWYKELFREEAIYQVKRLRNHPSIVLWCGNNENEGVKYGGWGTPKRKRYYGENIFYKLLPEICSIYDSTRPYLPSSPYGDEDKYNSEESGDCHPYERNWRRYSNRKGRFISETGFQSFPDMETIKSFTKPKDRTLKSKVMLNHQKTSWPDKFKPLLSMAKSVFGFEPKSFDNIVYLSQVSWAEGVKFSIEHWRRRKFNTSGILFWQLNDCWPVISWSFVDYYLRPKLCYFSVKRTFKPIITSFVVKDNKIVVYLINDKLIPFKGNLSLRVIDFKGNEFYKRELEVETKENSKKVVFNEKVGIDNPSSQFILSELKEKGEIIYRDFLFFKEYRELRLPEANVEIKKEKLSSNSIKLRLKTDTFAPFVKISSDVGTDYSDNFLFLLPKEEMEVILISEKGIEKVEIMGLNFKKQILLL